MKNNILNNIKGIILGLIIISGASYVLGAWNDPSCTPGSAGCYVEEPVNSGFLSQSKSGGLSVGTTTLPQGGYVFYSNDLSNFSKLVSSSFTLVDGTQANNRILTSDANGIASWKDLPGGILPSTINTANFSILVKRNSTQYQNIPYVYQYCAISQLGADFANSDNSGSSCAVNRNVDGTWTLSGTRGDDPDFYCNARCFYSTAANATFLP